MEIISHRAFRRFFEEFYPAVDAFLVGYTGGDMELARDLAQDTFLRVYERRHDIATVNHARAFLYTTARRLYLDHCKHRSVEMHYLDSYRDTLRDELQHDYAFLKAVTLHETHRILYGAIDRLPQQTRRIVLLNLQGKSNPEIAEELEISVNTVKSLKKSAYSALRTSLSKELSSLLALFLV